MDRDWAKNPQSPSLFRGVEVRLFAGWFWSNGSRLGEGPVKGASFGSDLIGEGPYRDSRGLRALRALGYNV